MFLTPSQVCIYIFAQTFVFGPMLGSLAARIHEPLSRTEWQRRHFEQVSDSARLASERALPELLAALDGHTFRERLVKRCVDT